jgi:hypothetical protein
MRRLLKIVSKNLPYGLQVMRDIVILEIGRVLISGDKFTSRHLAFCMSNANIASRALFVSFLALTGIPGHHLKHVNSPPWCFLQMHSSPHQSMT